MQLNIQIYRGSAATCYVSGEVVHLIPSFSAVHPGIQSWKNYWNLSTFARVMRHNVCAQFFESVYCISTHLTFQVSQGSAATDLRWGGNFNKFLFRNSSLYIVMKKLQKSVTICLGYRKNAKVSRFFYGTQCTGWVKKVAPLRLSTIFSLGLSLFASNSVHLLAIYIHICLPIFIYLS